MKLSEIWGQVELGHYISVRVSNKHGDHNLDGAIISGVVKDVVVTHSMLRLESGWCCHLKDDVLVWKTNHEPA